MHWPEYQVSPSEGYLEMYIGHGIVHIAAIHFRKPVIYSAEHTKESRYAHYDMEMRNNEIGIVQVDVQG